MRSIRVLSVGFLFVCLLSAIQAFEGGRPAPAAPVAQKDTDVSCAYRLVPLFPGGTASKALSGPGGSPSRPAAMALGDLDEDGTADLLLGCETSRGGLLLVSIGNPRAAWPPPNQEVQGREEISKSQSPFLAPFETASLPFAPSFLAVGDFNADGHSDAAALAFGSPDLLWFPGDGTGTLGAMKTIALPGRATAALAADLNRRDGLMDLAVAVQGSEGSKLLVFEGPDGALFASPEAVPIAQPVSALASGDLDGDTFVDLALLEGAGLAVLRGRDRKLSLGADFSSAVPPPALERIPQDARAVSLAVGDWIEERNPRREVALLSQEGRLLIAWRDDAERQGAEGTWRVSVVSSPGKQNPPGDCRLLAAGLSTLVFLDPSKNRVEFLAAGAANQGAPSLLRQSAFEPGGAPLAALPARLNGDAAPDLILLLPGQPAPLLALSQPKSTYIVTTTADSGAGSLRQAILDANSGGGSDTISFNLSGTPPFTISPASALPTLTNPVTLDATTQPGYAGVPLVELEGSLAGASTNGLRVDADGCSIRGLVIRSFGGIGIYLYDGDTCVIQGNYIGTDATGALDRGNGTYGIFAYTSGNTIGGSTALARNLISGNGSRGVELAYGDASGNIVRGNYIGTDVTGTVRLYNSSSGVECYQAPSNTIGGTAAGEGNLLSGNSYAGVNVYGASGGGNQILGNRVGTNAAGTASLKNSAGNVVLDDSPNNTVGGTTAAARNLLSGSSEGVHIEEESTDPPNNAINNLIQGNYIGTDPTGNLPLSNTNHGVDLMKAIGNTVGGAAAGARNVIAANKGAGIYIGGTGAGANVVRGNVIGLGQDAVTPMGNVWNGVLITSAAGNGNLVGGSDPGMENVIACNQNNGIQVDVGTGQSIRRNRIFASAKLGIDLGGSGVTPNDPLDPDVGPNLLQNFPLLSAYAPSGCTGGTLDGSLNSLASTAFTLDFFANPACNPSGYGEGELYLGSTSVTTNASGDATFSIALAVPLSTGAAVTGTATDPAGNSSEFSPCLTLASGSLPGEVQGLLPCAGSTACLLWTAEPSATSYTLYRGLPADLPKLITPDTDACTRASYAAPTTAGTLTEVPAPGAFFWYLVTAVNACGEGPVGIATQRSRVFSTSGGCL